MVFSRIEMLKKSASAATYNIILQLFLRMITFVLNMVMIRHTSKEMLGIVNIRLMLLQSTIFFLATEPFDMAALSKVEKKNWKQVVNLMWFTIPIAAVFSTTLGWVWLNVFEIPDEKVIPYYYFGVVCYAVSPCIATVARPLYIVAQSFFYVRLRVVSVAATEVFKCIFILSLVLYKPHLGLITFAVGQVLGEFVYVGIYYVYFYLHINDDDNPPHESFAFQSASDFFPQTIADKPLVHERTAKLTFSFFKQSILKQMLTEGEKYVMTVFGVLNFADQGVFGIINNLGALIPRFIFQPIEESGRLFFSQVLHRGQTFLQQSRDEAYLAYQVLKHLLRGVYLIGCVILVFGNCYAYLLLDLYGGKTLSQGLGPLLLQWYCVYVLIIAINGIMECFHFALMNHEETERYNKKMLLFSLVFLGSSLFLTSIFGAVGFILANCLTMCTRIFFSLLFIRQYYKGTDLRPLKSLIPSIPLVSSLAVSYVVMKLSEWKFCCGLGFAFRLVHIGIGSICFIAVLGVLYLTEKELIWFITKHYNVPRTTKKE